MARLTRTRFESTPATVTPATVTGARQPANVITRRSILARAAQQAQQATANPQRPALGGAGGTVQRLGGEPLPPRAQQSDGAVPVGGAVQRNQGITQGGAAGQLPLPFAPAPDLNSALLVEGVPTAANARARRSVDFAVDTLTETLYRWDSTGGDDELGAWIVVSGLTEQIDVPIDQPENRAYVLCQSQRYKIEIVALFPPPGITYTAAISPAVGQSVEVGGTITLTLSGIGGEVAAAAFSIETRRI